MEDDIINRIHIEFSESDMNTALELLAQSGKHGRVARCIVLASRGSLDMLRKLIDLASVDERDVIIAGEYDDAMQHIRDLTVSFLVESPDFWVSKASIIMARLGYQLVSVDSDVAVEGPFDYQCDRSEGTALFKRRDNLVQLSKRNRTWTALVGDEPLRNVFNNKSEFANEDEFEPILAVAVAETDKN